MKLIGAPLSPFVRKVRIVAAEKGLSYDFDPTISPMNMPENYSQIHPLRRIPALVVEEGNPRAIINDSSAICGYFEKLQPTPSIYPSDPLEFGRNLWLEEYSDSHFTETIGLKVFRPVIFNAFSGKAPDTETAENGVQILRDNHFKYLSEQLGNATWFGNDLFSLADISIGCNLVNLMHAGYRVKESDSPSLAAFFERFMARESVAALVASDLKGFEKMGYIPPALN
jgi:glutathione S-transferase